MRRRPNGPAAPLHSRFGHALDYLDGHVNFEKAASRHDTPTLDKMLAALALLGDPQTAYPVVHVTGTNGKGSTARMASALLAAHGLQVGTYTSPHLERLNERIVWDGEPIEDDSLAEALLDIELVESHLGTRLTHFEVLTAAAFRWFADVAVDVAVVEVGLGGRWDSTNVASGEVAVVTNVGLDHAEVIGPTLRDIATEKAGIIKPRSTVVLGETDPSLVPIFLAPPAAAMWRRDVEFGCTRNVAAVGGRLLDLETPGGVTSDLFLPLHGPHQGDNAACALAATEAFFGRPISPSVAASAFASVTVPGRFEIVRRRPLVVLDGAHNPDGARALRRTLDDDFSGRRADILVVGFTAGRSPEEMLELIGASSARQIIAVAPPHPRALPAAAVAAAAGPRAITAANVPAAIARALESAADEDFVLVTGSLYLVGDARAAL
ncbi:MAG: bifunctional folylpolyglutamate synthase/dihydrofolate synthase [Acidimicrobiales bacterium]